jgi:hypothetical protein
MQRYNAASIVASHDNMAASLSHGGKSQSFHRGNALGTA